MSVLLVTSTIGPRLGPRVTVLQFFGYVGLFLGVCLILRVIVAVARGSPLTAAAADASATGEPQEHPFQVLDAAAAGQLGCRW